MFALATILKDEGGASGQPSIGQGEIISGSVRDLECIGGLLQGDLIRKKRPISDVDAARTCSSSIDAPRSSGSAGPVYRIAA